MLCLNFYANNSPDGKDGSRKTHFFSVDVLVFLEGYMLVQLLIKFIHIIAISG